MPHPMKRPASKHIVKWTTYDALADVGTTRLKLIASIAIEYNSIEDEIDCCIGYALSIPRDQFRQVTSRINGMDGKLAVLKHFSATSPLLAGGTARMIAEWVTSIELCKGGRDAVIHARIDSPKSHVVPTISSRGKMYEVDIRNSTLRLLYRHIRASGLETSGVSACFWFAGRHAFEPENEAVWTSELRSKEISVWSSKLASFQAARKSLPPLPRLGNEGS